MSRNDPFKKIGGAKPGRSVFNLSYRKLFDAHAGWLIPICADEMVPGDTFKMGVEILIRLNPMICPVIHEINAYVHYFFVPYRILWDGWEEFITGGIDGDDTSTVPIWNPLLPAEYEDYSLWDYMGFSNDGAGPVVDILPNAFPLYAYNTIWNYYYRDQNISQERALTEDDTVALRAFEKDYFSASLPFQQRGTAPALPLTGLIPVITNDIAPQVVTPSDSTPRNIQNVISTGDLQTDVAPSATENIRWSRTGMVADVSTGITSNVSDLRLSFQIQKFMERNARAGVRYQEFLRSHFGYSAKDERLNYPEYLFGKKVPIIISEVLQTSATGFEGGPNATTPQGNLAGHGISSNRSFIGSFTAPEFGCIMGIFSILPRTAYSQGINRQWHRETRYDYPFPEFANLSEQPVRNAEIYSSRVADGGNLGTFGYVGRYDEMRTKHDLMCGAMKQSGPLTYWHLGRLFANTPTLNEEFMYCDGSQPEFQRIFSEQTMPNYICHVGNIITAIRPIPTEATPGLIDHG